MPENLTGCQQTLFSTFTSPNKSLRLVPHTAIEYQLQPPTPYVYVSCDFHTLSPFNLLCNTCCFVSESSFTRHRLLIEGPLLPSRLKAEPHPFCCSWGPIPRSVAGNFFFPLWSTLLPKPPPPTFLPPTHLSIPASKTSRYFLWTHQQSKAVKQATQRHLIPWK